MKLRLWGGGWAGGSATIVSVQPSVRADCSPGGASVLPANTCWLTHCLSSLLLGHPPPPLRLEIAVDPGTLPSRGWVTMSVWLVPKADPCTQWVCNKYRPMKMGVCLYGGIWEIRATCRMPLFPLHCVTVCLCLYEYLCACLQDTVLL